MNKLNKYFKNTLVTKEEIKKAVEKLGKDINKQYANKKIVAIGLLKGVFIFISDIVRELNLDVEIEFLIIKSYSNGSSNRNPKILLDIKKDIQGKDVIIFEDIIDTGRTLKSVQEYLKFKGAKSIKIAALLTKPSKREVCVDVEWSLFEISDEIAVGYGLDYNEKFRNLSDIMSLSDEGIKHFKK